MVIRFVVTLIVLWLWVWPAIAQEGGKSVPYAWNRDQLWSQLEQRFVAARTQDCRNHQSEIARQLHGLNTSIRSIETTPLSPDAPVWDKAEHQMLSLGPLLAACPDQLPEYVSTVTRLQKAIKRQAQKWLPQAQESRRRLYQIIYGGRTAIEEILLQAPNHSMPALWKAAPIPSVAPSIEVHGITLHSGDMLVSRGGAATSALIARGSDYPGNFSHVSLLYIDEVTRQGSVIEALIETGVQIHSVEEYLRDKKFRIMVLRLRPDLPAVA